MAFEAPRLISREINPAVLLVYAQDTADRQFSIGELADLIQQVTGTDLPIAVDEKRIRPQASEVNHLECDYSKATRLCGWKPQVNLTEGLAATWKWLQQQRELSGSGEYVV